MVVGEYHTYSAQISHFNHFRTCYKLSNWTCVLTHVVECRGHQPSPTCFHYLARFYIFPILPLSTEQVALCSSDLVQNLSVAGQELRQVFDELLDALQSSLLHNGARFLCDGLWDGVSGQILQRCRQV